MKARNLATIFIMGLMALYLFGCGGEQPIDVAAVTSQPKAFVGSDTCKMCHLEHYDSWKNDHAQPHAAGREKEPGCHHRSHR